MQGVAGTFACLISSALSTTRGSQHVPLFVLLSLRDRKNKYFSFLFFFMESAQNAAENNPGRMQMEVDERESV